LVRSKTKLTLVSIDVVWRGRSQEERTVSRCRKTALEIG